MMRIAAGDHAAIFDLFDDYRVRLRATVRRHLRACGVDAPDPDDVDGLALEACLELASVATAWRPDGAMPWIWAGSRVRAVVVRHVGIHADSTDDRPTLVASIEAPRAAACTESPLDEQFRALAARCEIVRLFDAARCRAGLTDDELWAYLRYRMQKAQGDPSPAHTVAPEYGVTPQTMRKRMSRATRRLQTVIERDPEYAALTEYVLAS